MANPPGAPGPAPGSGQSSNSGLPYLNSPFGDTTYTKVFVGGLAWETQSETLRRHFEQYGDILEAVVITDKNTRRSKGYGFVTFRDPESAARACDDPSPTIDGRRANCNLASLGRLRHPPTQARPGTAGPYIGGVPVPHGAYVGSSGYQHLLPYGYNQQGFPYLPYGYAAYGSEYASYPQMYNPYTGQQFVQVYGVPAPVNSMAYPLGQPGQPGQPLPGGPGYMAFQNYQVPNQTLLQFGTPNVNGVAPGGLSSVQPSFPPGAAQFPQSHLVVTVPSPQFSQGNGSDQTAGSYGVRNAPLDRVINQIDLKAGVRAAALPTRWLASNSCLASSSSLHFRGRSLSWSL